MYTVRCDDQLLLSKFVLDRKLNEPLLHLNANQPGMFEFTIYDTHPAYNSISYLSSKIKIYKDGNLVWLGRVKSSTEQSKRAKLYYCEECLAFLKDSFVPPYDFSGTPAEFFEFIITAHNNCVSNDQKFIIGNCDITDPNDYIVRSSITYDSAYNVLKSKLIKSFGGYIYITFDQNENPIISYYSDALYTSNQLVEFGENLVSYEQSLFYEEMYTACIPLGYKEENGTERLNIKSVNDDKEYLINTTLANVYGIRYAPVSLTTWDGVTVAANLKLKGQDWLQSVGVKYKDSVNLDAIDISTIRQGVYAFQFLWKVGFKLRTTVVYYVVTQLDINLNDEAGKELTLGDVKQVYTDLVSSLVSSEVGNVSDRVGTVEADYTTNGEARTISREEIQNDTSIIQRAEDIISTALEQYVKTNDFDTMRTTIMSQITQLANSVEFQFTSTGQAISELDGSVQSQFASIESFIRLLATQVDEHGHIVQNGGIVIGESTSEIKLKLENDVLYFFMGDESIVTTDTAIAWFKSNQLNVNNSTIQNLTLGIQGQYLDARIVGVGDNRCVLWSGRLS